MIKIDDIKEMKSIYGVYAIKNTISNKWYFGSSVDEAKYGGIYKRLIRHVWELKNNKHHNDHLQNSWNKHGEESFEFYLVEECDKEIARNRERIWIEQYREKAYNMTTHTEYWGGADWTEERRKKQSGKNHHMYGKHHTDDTKALISESRKGITAGENHHLYGVGHTDETKKKMSESHKLLVGDKNPFYSKKHTEETKRINSEKKKKWFAENKHPRKGVKTPDDVKRKQAIAKLSKPPKSGFKGVATYKGGKFSAYIYINRNKKCLGVFDDAEEAAKNYDFFIKQLYPEGDVYLNFPEYDYTNFVSKYNVDKVLS